MFKKVLSTALAMCMLCTASLSVSAADIASSGGTGSTPVTLSVTAGAIFSVTVPMSLTVSVDANGDVTVASNAKITNNSLAPVSVTNVTVTGVGDWAVVDYASNMAYEKVNTKKVGFKINDCVTDGTGVLVFDDSKFDVMNGSGVSDGSNELAITYDAVVPAQASAVSDANVVDVVFTINWAT